MKKMAYQLALPVLFGLAFAAVCSITTADDAERMNVVWIIADDLSPDLGCYGYEEVQTPHIDRLSNQGARYASAFATAPVCSSSRSAFITGVHQTTTGTHHHRTIDKHPLPKPIEPITEIMRRAGYYVCNVNSSMKRAGKSDYNFLPASKMYDAPDWSKRKKGQPFFAQVQVHEPHRDFIKAKTDVAKRDYKIPAYYPEHRVIRADWANYMQSVEVLDAKVGDVIARLEKEGLTEQTVVFFFGDHGRPHYRDKQWLYDGGVRVPLIVKWPKRIQPGTVHREMVSLIDVAAATVAIAGEEIPDWMQGRDLLADDFHGREMVFAARDRCGSTLDRIRSVRTKSFKYIRNFEPERSYSQHSGYKEMQYPGMTVARVLKMKGQLTGPPSKFWAEKRPAEELYDLENDPDELHNLADSDAHAKVLKQLRDALNLWIKETNDQGRFPEASPEKLQTMVAPSDKWYRDRMKKRGLPPHPDPEAYLKWWESELGLR